MLASVCSFIVVLSSFTPSLALSQVRLTVINVNTTGYDQSNRVKADILVTDRSTGRQLKDLIPSQFVITENGTPVTSTSITITCPPTPPPSATPQPLSLALSFDISGSMWAAVDNNRSHRYQLSNAIAATLLTRLDFSITEVATQICNDHAFIASDFTNDKAAVLQSFPRGANGGNDFVEQLLNPQSGLLPLAARGRNRENRVAMLFTDAFWSALPDAALQQCIQLCQREHIRFYAFVLGPSNYRTGSGVIANSLKTIANATGGQVFEDVLTEAQANIITQQLATSVLQVEVTQPCELSWISKPQCESNRSRLLQIGIVTPTLGTDLVTLTYNSSDRASVQIVAGPPLSFGIVSVGKAPTSSVGILSANEDVGSVKIEILPVDSPFKLDATAATIKSLQKGVEQKFGVTFKPTDEDYVNASIVITTSVCTKSIPLSGGNATIKPKLPMLTLVKPNGGERFLVGSDTVITWKGILPSDSVKLDYSTDNGKTWRTVADTATGLSYIWKRIPDTPSELCLMRVQQLSDNSVRSKTDTQTKIDASGRVNSARYNTDGSLVVVAPQGSDYRMYDTNGVEQSQFLGSGKGPTLDAVFVPNEKCVVASKFETGSPSIGQSRSCNFDVGPQPDSIVTKIGFDDYGRYFVTASNDSTARIYNCTPYNPLTKMGEASSPKSLILRHKGIVKSAVFGGIGASYVATASADATVVIWDFNGTKLQTLPFSTSANYASFHPTKPNLVVVALEDGMAEIWNWSAQTQIAVLRGHTKRVNCAAFSADGTLIVTASDDSTARVWDAKTGTGIATLRNSVGHKGAVNTAFFNPKNNQQVLTAGSDGLAIIWKGYNNQPFLQEDISDSVWAILKPLSVAKDVQMGEVLVDKPFAMPPFRSYRDSSVVAVIRNTGTTILPIDAITFDGIARGDFSVVGNLPPFTIAAGGSAEVEFRFRPSAVITRTAQMIIRSLGDTLRTAAKAIPTISGIGIDFSVAGDSLNFGSVTVDALVSLPDRFILKYIPSTFMGKPLVIDSVRILRPDGTPYDAGTAPFSQVDGNAKGFTTNGSQSLSFAFQPKAIGQVAARVAFYYKSPSGAGSPVYGFLYGTGILNAPRLTATELQSILRCETRITATLVVQNTGTKPLVITNVLSSIAGVSVVRFPKAIDVGKQDSIGLSMDINTTSPLASSTRGSIIVISTGANADVSADANGRTFLSVSVQRLFYDFTLSENPVQFGLVATSTATLGQPVRKQLTLRNTGTLPLTFAPPLAFGRYFRIETLPSRIEAGAVAQVTMSIIADSLGKNFSATAAFPEFCGNSFTLAATTKPTFPAITTATTTGSTDGTGLAADTLLCRTSFVKNIVLSNFGSQALEIDATLSNTDDFSFVKRPASIQALSSDTVRILVAPKFTGVKTSTLTVRSNAGNLSVLTFTLRATKDVADFSVQSPTGGTSANVEFTDVPVGAVRDAVFAVRNTGTVLLVFANLASTLTAGRFTIARLTKGVPNAPLLPGDTVQVRVRFTGGDKGSEYRLSDVFMLTADKCGLQKPLPFTVAIAVPYAVIVTDVRSYTWRDTLMCLDQFIFAKQEFFLLLKNRGTDEALVIDSVRIEGANAGDFIVQPKDKIIIPPTGGSASAVGASLTVQFVPRDTGSKAATIVLYSNSHNADLTLAAPLRIPLSGRSDNRNFTLSASALTFINAPTVTKTQTLTIRNIGSLPLVWKNLPARSSSGMFTISLAPNPLPRDAAGTVTVEFLGRSSPQEIRDFYDFTDECDHTKRLQLVAMPPTATVAIDSASARAGDTVNIRLFVRNRRNITPELMNADIGMVTLSYNASLLKPLFIVASGVQSVMPASTVQSGVRAIPIPLTLSQADESVPVAVLRFRAALGNNISTPLFLEVTSPTVLLTTATVGMFALKDLSNADGTRLINGATEVITNVSIQPNPSSNSDATVEYDVKQEMSVECTLTDLFGREQKIGAAGEAKLMQKALPSTRNQFMLNLSGITTPGVYFLNLRSPLQALTRKLTIIR